MKPGQEETTIPPYVHLKRGLDVAGAVVLLVLLAPILLVLCLLIAREDGRPVVFSQRRIGLDGREFILYKFRTMRRNTPDISTAEMKRLGHSFNTRIGAWLRKLSLDELPQLWNILRGDMSFIGPRPALWSQYDLIELREVAGVHSVRPGITGLAQVKGRDDLDVPTKVAYDRDYVAKQSLWLDMWIVWRTLAEVVSARGNY